MACLPTPNGRKFQDSFIAMTHLSYLVANPKFANPIDVCVRVRYPHLFSTPGITRHFDGNVIRTHELPTAPHWDPGFTPSRERTRLSPSPSVQGGQDNSTATTDSFQSIKLFRHVSAITDFHHLRVRFLHPMDQGLVRTPLRD